MSIGGQVSTKMSDTYYSISGQNFSIKTPNGDYLQNAGLAIVQWEKGYDPAQHELYDWASTPIVVNWNAWYVRDYQGVGQGVIGSNGQWFTADSPLYLFIDFYNASNYNQSMGGQVWMGQITDALVMDGGEHTISLNASNIRSVVGSDNGFGGLYSENVYTWSPHAIPEPSSYGIMLGVVFLGVALWRKMTTRTSA
jgi:hypothetical protein